MLCLQGKGAAWHERRVLLYRKPRGQHISMACQAGAAGMRGAGAAAGSCVVLVTDSLLLLVADSFSCSG